MTTPIPVHIATDVCEGRGAHYFSSLAAPLLLAIKSSHEVPTPMGWAPGRNATHAFARSVKHRGQMIAQQGHDCGPLIPEEVDDLPCSANVMSVYVVPNTSRKMMFGSGTVQAGGTAIGVSKGALIPFFTCSDPIRFPTVHGTTHQANTVIVGATAADLAMGWIAMSALMALDTYKFVKLCMSEGKELPMKVAKKVTGPINKFNPFGFSEPDEGDAVNALLGLSRSVSTSYETGWRTPITISLGQSTKAGTGMSTGLTYTPSTKKLSWTTSGTVRGQKARVDVTQTGPTPTPVVSGPPPLPPGYRDDPELGYVKEKP